MTGKEPGEDCHGRNRAGQNKENHVIRNPLRFSFDREKSGA